MSPARAETGARSRGRRPGGADTRAAIVDAARRSFAAHGYDRVSLRGIARDADVDPALIHHYFDGKAALFAETMDLPVNPRPIIERLTTGDPERLGWRIIETFLAVWDPPERREVLVALIRSASANDDAARMLREFVTREVFGRIAASVGARDAQLRAGLAASQVIGLAFMRYVVRAPGLAEASNEEIVARLGPVLQRHLVDSAPVAE